MAPSPTPWRALEAPDSFPDPGAQGGPALPEHDALGPAARPVSRGTSPGAGSDRKSTAPVPRGPIAALVVATILLVAGAAWMAAGAANGTTVTVDATGSTAVDTGAPTGVLIVDVAGAVLHPGVYHLPLGSRVADAVTSAGGYGPRVDATRVAMELNLAAPLSDGQHLVIPSRDDGTSGGAATGPGSSPNSGSGSGSTGPLDLNRATAAELDTLPGIGPVTAAKIVAARETSPFTSVQDLRDRKLVGDKTFEGLRDLVTVR